MIDGEGGAGVEVRRRAVDQFAMIEAPIIDDVERVDLYGLAVYNALARHADVDRACWPGIDKIARLARCSRTRAKAAVKALAEIGYIEVEARFGADGNQRSNSYTLIGRGGRGHVATGGRSPGDRGEVTGRPRTISKRTRTNEQPVDHLFDSFWNVYPRKVDKVGARKAWIARMVALTKDTEYERSVIASEIMAGTGNYLKTVAGKEIEFVMHPATFIGPSMRWRDYLHLGPKRVPSSAGSSGRTAAQVEAEIAAEKARIEEEHCDPAKVQAAAAKAAAFRRRAGLPSEVNRGT